MENGMLVDLRRWYVRRDRLLCTSQATVPTLVIFLTTVSCSTPGIDEREPLFSVPLSDAANPQSTQKDEGQPKIRRAQPKTSAPPKVAKVNAPKAKKANTTEQLDAQREQQLYQEFLEWQKRQKDLP